MTSVNLTVKYPSCHGNEVSDETDYNFTRIENIAVPLAPSRLHSGMRYTMMLDKFLSQKPRCHGNKI